MTVHVCQGDIKHFAANLKKKKNTYFTIIFIFINP